MENDLKDKLSKITECEKLSLPIALFGMILGKIDPDIEQTAITKETNITFTRTELNKLYGK